MLQFFSYLGYILRGKSYFGDFTKTLILGIIFYILGLLIISLQFLILTSIGSDGPGIAILYYLIIMPIVLIPVMGVYFFLLILLRFFLSLKIN